MVLLFYLELGSLVFRLPNFPTPNFSLLRLKRTGGSGFNFWLSIVPTAFLNLALWVKGNVEIPKFAAQIVAEHIIPVERLKWRADRKHSGLRSDPPALFT